MCCEEDYFPKGKFNLLFHSFLHSVYLVFPKKFVFYYRFVCRALSQARNQDFMGGGGGANEAKVDQNTEMYFLLYDPFI